MVVGKMNTRDVQDQLGHANLSTTDTYLRTIAPEGRMRAVADLDLFGL